MAKINSKIEQMKGIAKEIFADQVSSIKDYSHLTPEAAERKLNRMKYENGWVDDEDFKGLMRIINGQYPVTLDDMPFDIADATPSEVSAWFNKAMSEATYGVSSKVIKTVAAVLKPYHEEELLREMQDITPVELETWMAEKKENGFFFSNKVYSALRKKWLEQYKGE